MKLNGIIKNTFRLNHLFLLLLFFLILIIIVIIVALGFWLQVASRRRDKVRQFPSLPVVENGLKIVELNNYT